MRRMLDKIFSCYGSEITVVRGSERLTLRGFFQPQLSRAKQDLFPEMTQVGVSIPGQYLLLCPAEPEVQVSDTVIAGGSAYLLRRKETLRGSDGPLYQWALCTVKGGADTWPVLS